MSRFALASTPIDVAALRTALADDGCGGFCSFEGWVRNRNDGRAVTGLDYEAYAALAEVEGERIVAEALQRYDAVDARCVHRTGTLAVGDSAVWVGVVAAHRDQAFRACRYIIDQIKHRLPVWKKEHYVDGDTAWVACSHPAADDDAAHSHASHHHR